jgi:hypothetical protein
MQLRRRSPPLAFGRACHRAARNWHFLFVPHRHSRIFPAVSQRPGVQAVFGASSLNTAKYGCISYNTRVSECAPRRLKVAISLRGISLREKMTSFEKTHTQPPAWNIDGFHPPADPRWSPIAVQDVEAAHRLLQDNHPAAAPVARAGKSVHVRYFAVGLQSQVDPPPCS